MKVLLPTSGLLLVLVWLLVPVGSSADAKDAFLPDAPELFDTTRGFIDAAARARGVD